MSSITTRASKGSALTWTEGDANITNLNNDKIEAVVDDTSPQLGGDLDVNGHAILASTGDLQLSATMGSIKLGSLTWPTPTSGGGGAGGGSISGTISSSSSATNKLSLDTTAGMSVGYSITFTGTDISSIGLGMGSYYITDIWPLSNEIQISMTMGGAAQSLNTGSGYTDAHFQATASGGGAGGGGTDQYLAYNSGTSSLSWITPATPSSNLSSLTDVMISGASAGQVLTYDSGTMKWKNQNASSSGLANIVEDTTPQLGGTLDTNGNSIDMGTNDITDTKVGNWDTAYSWGNHASAGYLTTALTNLVQDTNPQLGGSLDIQANTINTSTTNGDITLTPNGTGKVYISPSTGKLTVGASNGSIVVGGSSTGTITTGLGSLTLSTNNGTNSGSIAINAGANTNIVLTPNGTGKVQTTQINYSESVFSLGTSTLAGGLNVLPSNGNIQTVTVNASTFTLNAFTGILSGGNSVTLFLTGGTTAPTAITQGTGTWKWAGGSKALSGVTGTVDVLSIFYDTATATHYASINKGFV